MENIRKDLEKVFGSMVTAEILDLARVCAIKNWFLTVSITTKQGTIEAQLFPANGDIPARRDGELGDGFWGVKIKKLKGWGGYDRRQGRE